MSSLNQNLKSMLEELEEYEAIEKFMLNCNDRDERLKAHYREGAIVNGIWVNNVESEVESDEELPNKCDNCG